jgi:ubiquinone/menaquinone biosynthesis C-methylase UbiE
MADIKRIIEFITFPLRAGILIDTDRFGLTSLRTERFNYVSMRVKGKCLDIGCGRDNAFVTKHLKGNGVGIDVFPYSGLTASNIVKDMTHLPFKDQSFSTVTFIACLNHIPKDKRLAEFRETIRCLKPGGRVIVTMGNPIAETLVHKLVIFYDAVLGTHIDVDSERGMADGETYYLVDQEIRELFARAGLVNTQKEYFSTQWWLNHLFMAMKPK